ncbi:MAG: hypothetical protein GWP59_01095 [Chlamydiales bacterium]|nr:FKBP-type peptidyl-prolyl cis-trans isomerase [Chlamydiales bacterium]NCF70274.1 hypothetical protein [Chlamydiales bacterium]
MTEFPKDSSEVWVRMTAYDNKGNTVSSECDELLHFTIGTKTVFPALENMIKNMRKGETKVIELSCKDTFGDHLPENIAYIKTEDLPNDFKPQEGMLVAHSVDQKKECYGEIVKVSKEMITVDSNHPLAGKRLSFKVTLDDFTD